MDLTPVWLLVAGAIGWFVRTAYRSHREDEQRVFEWRMSVYLDAVEPFMQMLTGTQNPDEMEKVLKSLTTTEFRMKVMKLALIGSDEVVKAYNAMMTHIYREGPPLQLLPLLCAFLLAIRKDIGKRATRLVPLDMMRAHVKDIDSLDHALLDLARPAKRPL